MLNAERLRNSANKGAGALVKNKYGKEKDKFPWMNPSSFKPGSFKLRLCPRDPSKCPLGYHIYTTYKVEKEVGAEPIKVLAMESWDPEQDDTISSILEVYEEVKQHLTASVCEAIESMFPSRYYLFPCTVFARTIEEASNSGKMYTKLVADSSAPEMGVLFAVEQKSDELPPLVRRIADLSAMYPTMTMEDDTGRYLNFTRTGQKMQTRYTLDALPENEPMGNVELLKDYPDLTKFGKNFKKDQYAMKSLIQSCWWWEPLSEFVEL